jgi:adenosylmethionine-8-amino-7-oxononanoate aminotransferase
MDWLARDRRRVWHPFTQADEWDAQDNLAIVAAEGVWLLDADGRRYLDGVSSLWCNVLGHRHPAIDAAIRAQLDRVAHSTLLGLTHPPAVELAERLCAMTGLDRVFYSDSGSTAVEVALKMAFQCQQQRGHTGRTRFAALAEAYHGDTLGSVSVGGIALFHSIYRPLLFDAVRLPSPERAETEEEATCLAAAQAAFAAHGPTLAALVVEPRVQGAAGMRRHSAGFLARLCSLARDAGALVVADEVATGFGRTGRMFASEGVDPDFVCLAKGLTGGYLPLAATLTRERVYDAFRGEMVRTFFHGHTYTGNPLACAAALATLDALPGVIASLPPRIDALREGLASLAHPAVREVRQEGLMAAIRLHDGGPRFAHRVALACRSHGVILRSLDDAVIVMPPLVMEPAQILACVEAVRRVLAG